MERGVVKDRGVFVSEADAARKLGDPWIEEIAKGCDLLGWSFVIEMRQSRGAFCPLLRICVRVW